MRHRQALFLILLSFSVCLRAQTWSGILDGTRAIDWSANGIPGGIPARATNCTTINASIYGNGSSDATSGIQSALNGCASGQTVLLSSGTFRINGSLTIPSNVTLRGAGAHNTILSVNGSGDAPIVLGGNSGSTPDINSSTAITSGATQGSTTLVVSSAAGISVGTYLMVTELNDGSIPVSINGTEGACTWCDGGLGWNGTRAAGQIVEVTLVNGTTIGIRPGLYMSYTNGSLATRFSAVAKNAGVENLQVYANNTGYGANFFMGECAYCWIKGVESNYTDGDHVDADWSYRGEIRDSYFHDAFTHAPGTHDSCLDLRNKSSAFLVENNIVRRLHVGIMLEWGAAGNVIAYNYDSGDFDAGSTNFLIGGFSMHGAHPWFNLLEGNVFDQIYPDSVWGTSSHNTHFRNWAIGTSSICNPLSGRGALGACWWAVQANRAVQISQAVRYLNTVGNVVGSAAMAALQIGNNAGSPMTQTASITAPTLRDYDHVAYGYTWGYGESSDDGTGAGDTSGPFTTAFIHGDYNNVSGATTWNSGHPNHTLPPSFYRSSKPSWFGNVPWPPIGPDVTAGIDAGGHGYAIPAQACYNNTTKDSNGALIFDPNSCYGQQPSPSAPAPPTNLTLVVK